MYSLWIKSFKQLLQKLSTIQQSKNQALDSDLLIINSISVPSKHAAEHRPGKMPKHFRKRNIQQFQSYNWLIEHAIFAPKIWKKEVEIDVINEKRNAQSGKSRTDG